MQGSSEARPPHAEAGQEPQQQQRIERSCESSQVGRSREQDHAGDNRGTSPKPIAAPPESYRTEQRADLRGCEQQPDRFTLKAKITRNVRRRHAGNLRIEAVDQREKKAEEKNSELIGANSAPQNAANIKLARRTQLIHLDPLPHRSMASLNGLLSSAF